MQHLGPANHGDRSGVPGSLPCLGHIRQFFESEVSAEVLENLAAVRERFRSAGAKAVEVALPPSFKFVIPAWDAIKLAELYAYHRPLFEAHRDEYPPKLRQRLEKGCGLPGHLYAEYLQHRILFQREMCAQLADVDAVFMPIASTTAPKGLASTGCSYFNPPWTVSGFPAMSLPTGRQERAPIRDADSRTAVRRRAAPGCRRLVRRCPGVHGTPSDVVRIVRSGDTR